MTDVTAYITHIHPPRRYHLQLWVQKNLNVVFDSLLKISCENGLSILRYTNRIFAILNVSKQIEKNGESVTITPFYERTNIVKQTAVGRTW